MVGRIIRNFTILKEIYKLKKNQYRKREDLERLQEKKLKKLITHAYNNVPLYNAKFKSAGIKPDDIRGLRDLSKIPLVTKEEIRDANLNDILSNGINFNECKVFTTSGSTGTPLKVYRSINDYSTRIRYHYILFECGLRFRDNIISLHILGDQQEKNWFQKIGLLRMSAISIKQPIQDIIDELIIIQPDALLSFPSIFVLLSEHTDNKAINPRMSLSGGETITDSMRRKINYALNTELFDIYATVEFGRLAYECKQHEGLHIISDHNIIEFLKEGESVSPGERGEIVVTDFNNYAMPFIRYRLGDIGVFSDDFCGCGRTYPLIEYIEGRKDDFLTLPSGRIISPRNINLNFIDSIDGISEFQIIQERKDKFLVNIVKGRGFSNNTVPDIKETIKSGCLGEEIDVEIRLISAIQREKTGKLMKIVSRV